MKPRKHPSPLPPPLLPLPHRFNHAEFFCLINEQFHNPPPLLPPQRKGGFDLFTHGGATYSQICTKINIKKLFRLIPSLFSAFLYNCHRNDPSPPRASPSSTPPHPLLSQWRSCSLRGSLENWRAPSCPSALSVCLSVRREKGTDAASGSKKAGVRRHFLFSAGPHGCPKVLQTHREVRFGPRVGSAAPSPGNSGGCPGRFFEIRIRLNDEILIFSCGINERKILSN